MPNLVFVLHFFNRDASAEYFFSSPFSLIRPFCSNYIIIWRRGFRMDLAEESRWKIFALHSSVVNFSFAPMKQYLKYLQQT